MEIEGSDMKFLLFLTITLQVDGQIFGLVGECKIQSIANLLQYIIIIIIIGYWFYCDQIDHYKHASKW